MHGHQDVIIKINLHIITILATLTAIAVVTQTAMGQGHVGKKGEP